MENHLKLHSYFPSITTLAIVFCLCISHGFSISSEARNKVHSFTIDLFHRDSPKSPLYDHTLTHSQRLTSCLRRSFHRAHHFGHHVHHHKRPSSTALLPDSGEYLMRILLGTPPIETWAIADTGSDLIWTQCKPCIKCFVQKDEIFNPSKSSTFKKVSCNGTCTHESSLCDPSTKTCSYSVTYGDRSYSKGDIAMETLRLGPKVAFPNITIGCAHESGGTFGSSLSGIVGLGGGKSSLISQLGSRIRGKFSYCLVDFTKNNVTSIMKFGKGSMAKGHGVVTTSIAKREPSTYLFLTLKGVSVGKKRFDIYSNQELKDFEKGQEGNIIIDSGTTLTLLPSKLYHEMIAEVERHIKKKAVPDPDGILDLCYSSLSEHEVPRISMHFNGGEVKLSYINVFVNIGANISCFAFAPDRGLSIYGNLAQINFLVGYDLEKKTVSFKKALCGA